MKFRLVDRITAWEPRRSIHGVKAVSYEEYELKAAFGGDRRLPESLALESLFQLGNWLIMLSSDFVEMGLVLRLERCSFGAGLGPGDVMQMELSARSYRDDGIVFDGIATSRGREVVRGEGCLTVPGPLTHYCDPESLRTLFGEIYAPEEAAR